METIFGMEFPLLVKFAISFAIVLILIGVVAFVVRRFGVRGVARSQHRGRQPRLAVVNSAAIDGRRNLVIVRRDNVEHLLLIGGPTDVLVKSNISPVPIQAGRDSDTAVRSVETAPPNWTAGKPSWPQGEPPRAEPAVAAEPRSEARIQPAARTEPVFIPQPFSRVEPEVVAPPVPAYEPAPLPSRPATVPPAAAAQDATPPIAAAAPVRTAEASGITAIAAALDLDMHQDAVNGAAAIRPPQPEPVSLQPAPSPSKVAARAEPALADDPNLANMAQRLEAALRRPIANGNRAAPQRPAVAPQRPPEPPRVAPVAAPTISVVTPAPAATPSTRDEAAAYENLQREMASLLGRKPGST